MVTTVNPSNTVAFPSEKTTAPANKRVARDSQTNLRLQLSNLLQTTLDLDQVLQFFFEQVQTQIPLGSMSFNNEKLTNAITLGKSGRHNCHYNLVTGQDQGTLGELSFSRGTKFKETELQLLELLITCLICPIRNALMYRDALQSAQKDPLTGAGNRLALENTMEREIALAKRYQQPLSILVIDIDNFKKINDNYGHSAGDCVLKDVSRQLSLCCRESDASYHSYRFGGEEFVVLLSNTNNQGALIAAERIRRAIEGMETNYNNERIKVTASVGTSSLLLDDSVTSLFDRADKALYKAKQNGRNQTVTAQELAIDDSELLNF